MDKAGRIERFRRRYAQPGATTEAPAASEKSEPTGQ
jgi:hypothetical protein